jgi:hypothetical protein
MKIRAPEDKKSPPIPPDPTKFCRQQEPADRSGQDARRWRPAVYRSEDRGYRDRMSLGPTTVVGLITSVPVCSAVKLASTPLM